MALARAMLPPSFPRSLDELAAFKVISNIDENEAILVGPENEPQIRNVHRNQIEVPPDTVRVRVLKNTFHPGGGTSVFRIEWNGKSMVYATDTESYVGGDTRLIEFASGTDLLIHDAQYTEEEYITGPVPKQGWGHSTPQMAITIAQAAGVKKLVLFHHEPEHDDDTLAEIEKKAQEAFPNTILAYEGLTIEL